MASQAGHNPHPPEQSDHRKMQAKHITQPIEEPPRQQYPKRSSSHILQNTRPTNTPPAKQHPQPIEGTPHSQHPKRSASHTSYNKHPANNLHAQQHPHPLEEPPCPQPSRRGTTHILQGTRPAGKGHTRGNTHMRGNTHSAGKPPVRTAAGRTARYAPATRQAWESSEARHSTRRSARQCP